MSGVYCQIVDGTPGYEEFCTNKALPVACCQCGALICRDHARQVQGARGEKATMCVSCYDLAIGPHGGPVTEELPVAASENVIDIRPRRALRR